MDIKLGMPWLLGSGQGRGQLLPLENIDENTMWPDLDVNARETHTGFLTARTIGCHWGAIVRHQVEEGSTAYTLPGHVARLISCSLHILPPPVVQTCQGHPPAPWWPNAEAGTRSGPAPMAAHRRAPVQNLLGFSGR